MGLGAWNKDRVKGQGFRITRFSVGLGIRFRVRGLGFRDLVWGLGLGT